MDQPLLPLARATHLLPGEAATRRDRNRAYLLRLTTPHLLLSHYQEAGLLKATSLPEGIHGGWDSPLSEIRGTVAAHWLSAAARLFDETGDAELKARADFIVAEIARCQQENGGEWCFPIPEKYLHWLRRGKKAWAPQYVCHKTMMGLLDMHLFAGSAQALDVVERAARWFTRFCAETTREQMSAMMALEETGGIMELWLDLYAVTHNPEHLALARSYERPDLYEPLLRGEDVLTNRHANMTVPEIHGAARAYEVTGEERYRKIVEAYWDLAVRRRGTFATGGQTSGEVWTPQGRQSSRLGEMTQEHCVVYNMMRLAEYLFRWTGSSEYADYEERNLLNGIFAQGHWEGRSIPMLTDPRVPPRGTVAYYLPLAAGSTKKWGSETQDFWCCHCTLLQANANHREAIYYRRGDSRGTELVVAQFIPSRVELSVGGVRVTVTQEADPQAGDILKLVPGENHPDARPRDLRIILTIEPAAPVEMTLKIRIPWWLDGRLRCEENGKELGWDDDGRGFASLRRTWSKQQVRVVLPRGLRAWPLPDRPDTVAFMDGPVVLAGLVTEERRLEGDIDNVSSMLEPDDERHWSQWMSGWHTVGQAVNFSLRPISEIGTETYTVYFPVRRPDRDRRP